MFTLSDMPLFLIMCVEVEPQIREECVIVLYPQVVGADFLPA